MDGHHELHIWCRCGRQASILYTPALAGLLRDELLRRLRCTVCAGRPVDIRIGWVIVLPGGRRV